MYTKSVFIAGPFKGALNPATGELNDNLKQQLLNLIQLFESLGYKVFNAHLRESWGKKFMTPDECTALDYEQINASELFVGFPGNPPSPGTHIEIGWATAMNKQVVLLLEETKEYAFLVRGLPKMSNTRLIRYTKEDDYLPILKQIAAEYHSMEVVP